MHGLKSYAPEGVTTVSAELLILKVRRLRGLVNQRTFPSGSTWGELPEGAKSEILYQVQGLTTVLDAADQRSAHVSVSSAEKPLAADSFHAKGRSVETVRNAVETRLLLGEPFAGTEEMDQAFGDAAVIARGAETMSLRRQISNIAAAPDN